MTPPPTLRFGYHGSLRAATAIARAGAADGQDIRLSEYDLTDPFRDLRAGDLDVMIVKFALREDDLDQSAVLTTDPRVAVVGAHHPLADRSSVAIEEVAEFDGFQCPGAFPAYVWDQVVPPRTPAGRPIRRRHRLVDAATMMATVTGTDAVHVSLASLADVAVPTVRVVPVHDLPPAPVTLAWVRGRTPAHVLAFVSRAETACAGSVR
ncbi:LysR substrate-binding domain-containing protein [Micromonospora sp. KC207]|uniref:LysR substrate-binding domain-containing protein n=1 Tax=Micromonospora sp. KC207 TaxID=2530377 RepID=UPI001A9D33DC|nr:LysR substrate-binding domain-containing protein [Micromonospora sp. KC207]